MRAAWMERFGDPAEVVTTRELPDPDAAGRDEVLLDLVASPINPAEQGVYAILPDLPYAAGMEGVARVTTRGDGVDHLTEGDLVCSRRVLGRGGRSSPSPHTVCSRYRVVWIRSSCRCSPSTRRPRTCC